MAQIAIVGSGVAGLGLAYFLRNDFQVTVYEKDKRAGGHSNTVELNEDGKTIPIDTGFMVFNKITYPNLLNLFNELSVPIKTTDMSFSVQHKMDDVEYSGASFNRLFGRRENLFRPRHWKFLLEIDRFNKEGAAAQLDANSHLLNLSLRQWAETRKYSSDLVNHYLIPMCGALWSAPAEKILQFPAITLLRFFKNHGLLGQDTQFQWWTVDGGAKVYVEKIRSALHDELRLGHSVARVCRGNRKVVVTDRTGDSREFDHVIFACHANQALEIISDARPEEAEILSAFSYQRNDTVLHSDQSVMPKERRCWSSWNYRVDQHGSTTHYWMNSLQDVSEKNNYFVTLNGEHLLDPKSIHTRILYHHPLFDLKALRAQQKLTSLNSESYRGQYFFCGSYFGFGFHEDALSSALALAKLLAGKLVCR